MQECPTCTAGCPMSCHSPWQEHSAEAGWQAHFSPLCCCKWRTAEPGLGLQGCAVRAGGSGAAGWDGMTWSGPQSRSAWHSSECKRSTIRVPTCSQHAGRALRHCSLHTRTAALDPAGRSVNPPKTQPLRSVSVSPSEHNKHGAFLQPRRTTLPVGRCAPPPPFPPPAVIASQRRGLRAEEALPAGAARGWAAVERRARSQSGEAAFPRRAARRPVPWPRCGSWGEDGDPRLRRLLLGLGGGEWERGSARGAGAVRGIGRCCPGGIRQVRAVRRGAAGDRWEGDRRVGSASPSEQPS